MNIFKRLIKNNWLKSFTEDTLTYDELTLKYSELTLKYSELKNKYEERDKILKDAMSIKQLLDWKAHNLESDLKTMLHDFAVLFEFVEKRKLSGPILDNFKNECIICLISSEYKDKGCIRFGDSCPLKIILSEFSEEYPYIFDSTKKTDFIKKIEVSLSLIDKIQKLRLRGDSEYTHLSWSPENFIEWMENENLTEYDFNHLFSSIVILRYPEILKAAEKRKKELFRKTKPKQKKESSFLNKDGKTTWYVKNVSPNHIVLSDINEVINRGNFSNLLRNLSKKQLDDSIDLKEQLLLGNLKRLTEKEYEKESIIHMQRHPIKPGTK